ncbi:MAG TPA: hypothetical protein VFX02_07250 [Gammaproteobacteria bacterium]|nr:hypothetical protein [Gammaproteobacteria bacterium]
MKGLFRTVVLVLAFGLSVQSYAMTPLEWSYAYILVTKTNARPLKNVCEAATDEKVTNEEFFNIAAEVLWERTEDKSLTPEATDFIWGMLYRSRNPKYQKVLAETGAAARDPDYKLYARKLLKNKKLDLNAPDIYQRGTVSLSAIRQGYIDSALQAQAPDAKAQPISKLQLNQSAESVFKAMGNPQAVDASLIDIYLTPVIVSRLSLFYRGQGAVVLEKHGGGSRRDADLLWRVAKIVEDPLAYELDMPYATLTEGGDAAAGNRLYFNIVMYGDQVGLKRLSERIYHGSVKADSEILDSLAERLVKEYQSAVDGPQVEGLAWAAKALGAQGNGRYQALLQTVSKEASSPKLRKHAGSASKSSKSKGVAQFEAGKTDLSALQRKYPPLYANVTEPRKQVKELEPEPAAADQGE